jgi:hypothetical protein
MLINSNPDFPVAVSETNEGKPYHLRELHSLPSLLYRLYTRDVPMYIKLKRELQLGMILKLLDIYEKGRTFKLGSGGIPIANRS